MLLFVGAAVRCCLLSFVVAGCVGVGVGVVAGVVCWRCCSLLSVVVLLLLFVAVYCRLLRNVLVVGAVAAFGCRWWCCNFVILSVLLFVGVVAG